MSKAVLKVHPNTSSGKVTIYATGLSKVLNIELHDTHLKLIAHEHSIEGSLTALNWIAQNGVFWITLETEKEVYRAEVILVLQSTIKVGFVAFIQKVNF